MQRTQVYLPEDLRREIDRERSQSGQSLADYLREAAQEKIKKAKKRKADLKKLAEDFVGSLKISRKEAEQWIEEIREDRRRSDERLEKHWVEVLKKKGS